MFVCPIIYIYKGKKDISDYQIFQRISNAIRFLGVKFVLHTPSHMPSEIKITAKQSRGGTSNFLWCNI